MLKINRTFLLYSVRDLLDNRLLIHTYITIICNTMSFFYYFYDPSTVRLHQWFNICNSMNDKPIANNRTLHTDLIMCAARLNYCHRYIVRAWIADSNFSNRSWGQFHGKFSIHVYSSTVLVTVQWEKFALLLQHCIINKAHTDMISWNRLGSLQ